jgi:hypothetical protein
MTRNLRMICTDITTTFWIQADSIALSSTVNIDLEYGDAVYVTGTDTDGRALLWHNTSLDYNTTFTYSPTVVTYNPCTPFLSIPSRIITLDRRWNTCIHNFVGLHDPPVILSTGSGFSAVTAPHPDPGYPRKTTVPSPAQAIQQPSASKTPAPGKDPIASKLPAVVTVGKATITENSASAFEIGSQTLVAGQQITYSNTILSIVADGRTLIIDRTSTQIIDQLYAIGTHTLSAGGPAATVSGTSISVKSGGENVVIGGSLTQDISVLLQGVGPGATKTLKGTTASVRIPGHHQETRSSLASRNVESHAWIRWQVVLGIIAGISAFV